jgi:hypothetical protein
MRAKRVPKGVNPCELLRDGRTVDAAARRAVREAVAGQRAAKPRTKAKGARSGRAA